MLNQDQKAKLQDMYEAQTPEGRPLYRIKEIMEILKNPQLNVEISSRDTLYRIAKKEGWKRAKIGQKTTNYVDYTKYKKLGKYILDYALDLMEDPDTDNQYKQKLKFDFVNRNAGTVLKQLHEMAEDIKKANQIVDSEININIKVEE